MDRLVLYVTRTGNVETFVDFIKPHLEADYCDDLTADISHYNKIVIGTYTWSNGKIPKQLKQYIIDHKNNLKGKEFFIFGSGNTIYPNFCGAVDGLSQIISDCGGIIKGSFKFEQRFHEDEYSTEELNKIIKKLTG